MAFFLISHSLSVIVNSIKTRNIAKGDEYPPDRTLTQLSHKTHIQIWRQIFQSSLTPPKITGPEQDYSMHN